MVVFFQNSTTSGSDFYPVLQFPKNQWQHFYPDFIFWLKSRKDNRIQVLFLDPHSILGQKKTKDKLKGFQET